MNDERDPLEQLLAELRRNYLGGMKVQTAVDVDPLSMM